MQYLLLVMGSPKTSNDLAMSLWGSPGKKYFQSSLSFLGEIKHGKLTGYCKNRQSDY